MTPRTTQAIVVDAPHQISVRAVPLAPLSQGDALVRTAYAGICATDFAILEGRLARIRYPHIPGHEWSGVVEAVGSGADEALVGCRVVGHNFLTCGRCPACHRGKWNECPSAQEIGFERAGGYGRFFVTRAQCLRVLPSPVSLRDGCLIEPTAVCVHAIERARIEVGDGVVVFGDGPIGLISLQLARLQGAASVVVVGGSEARLALAAGLGAMATIDHRREEDVPATISRHQTRTDVAVEASGNPKALDDALAVLGYGGRLSVIGDYGGAVVRADPTSIMHRNLTIVGSNASPGTWDKALALVEAGRVRLRPLISGVYPIEDWATALDVARNQRDSSVKVLFRLGEEE